MTKLIHETFQALGIPKTFRGYMQAVYAVELILEDEDRLRHITKEVYWKVADACNCKHCDIERNIRTIISAWVWREEVRCQFLEMAGYPLRTHPSVSEFLAIIAAHVQRVYAQSHPDGFS